MIKRILKVEDVTGEEYEFELPYFEGQINYEKMIKLAQEYMEKNNHCDDIINIEVLTIQ
jgi:hypothetical protein